MDVPDVRHGAVINRFTVGEPVDHVGVVNVWHVSKPDTDLPMLMKIPLLRPGEDPITIVGFEVEQMILARLSGPHVPRFVGAGDFERPYIVMEYVSGVSCK